MTLPGNSPMGRAPSRLLSPFFIGRPEPGIDLCGLAFDAVLPASTVHPRDSSTQAIERVTEAIAGHVSRALRGGLAPLVVSGDCLSAVACLGGAQVAGVEVGLVWFDGHGDFHTPETTISGHLGGMPLATVSGRGNAWLRNAAGLEPLDADRIWLVGGRDLESGERDVLRESGIARGRRLEEILPGLPSAEALWVHFDTDYIDSEEAPAMRYPAPNGPRVSEVAAELALLASSFPIVGASVSAWAPHLDPDGATARACCAAIGPLTGLTVPRPPSPARVLPDGPARRPGTPGWAS